MEAHPKEPTLEEMIAAYTHFVSIHCGEKQEAAARLDDDRGTLLNRRRKLNVPWTEPASRYDTKPLPEWVGPLARWMRSLQREDLPVCLPPELVQLLSNGEPPPKPAGQPAVQWPSTVTINLANRPQA